MPDSSNIVNALIALLGADQQLLTLMPNGAYRNGAPPSSTRYVVVERLDGIDIAEFGRCAIEDAHFMVKAVGLSTALVHADDVQQAAKRIHDLLEDVPFAVEGYSWMTTHRTQPVDADEPDGTTRTLFWRHRGGIYHVQFAPNYDTTGTTGQPTDHTGDAP